MKEHYSVAGTVCWFCGHTAGPGNWIRKLSGVLLYRACKDCHHAPSGQETQLRNADVEGMKNVLAGGEWTAGYWTQKAFDARVEEMRGYDPKFLDALKAKEYDDPFAQPTAERVTQAHKEYAKSYKLARKEQMKEQYDSGGGREIAHARYQDVKEQKRLAYAEGGGREAARARYLNGGGKEYARAYYEKQKAKRAVMEPKQEFNQHGAGI